MSKNVSAASLRRGFTVLLGLLLALALSPSLRVAAQGPASQGPDAAGEEPGVNEPAPAGANRDAPAGGAPASVQTSGFNMLDLYFQGGPLMYPITFFSFVVLVFGFERLLAIRRGKVLPTALGRELLPVFKNAAAVTFDIENVIGQMEETESSKKADEAVKYNRLKQLEREKNRLNHELEQQLQKAYQVCNHYPHTAGSKVIKAAILKAGRPHAEMEQAVKEASDREATRLYNNVRPLTLTAAVAPLLGLLGTVQGMIICFYQTASGAVHGNRAAVLAQGIYIAMVTTFAGLVVAIPATILAHWFEGRIQRLFHEIDDFLMNVWPFLEKLENRLRVSRSSSGREAEEGIPPVAVPSKGARGNGAPPLAKTAPPLDREEQRGI